jgi:DNA-directed RNA polymerase specialized sigma24 family protein
MAVRCSSTGKQLVHVGRETSADLLFEAHLSKLALFCLRFTQDKERAAALAERVLQKARRKIASSRSAPSFSGWLYSILREECLAPLRAKSEVPAAEPLRAAEEVQ